MPKMFNRFAKSLLLKTRYKGHFLPRYQYMFLPGQLAFICETLKGTAKVEGAIAEIGCAFGATTIFLNRHLDEIGVDKPYYAIDTFAGFVDDDISVEVSERGKQTFRDHYASTFADNDQAWFDLAMKKAKAHRVTSYKADVNKFDLTALGPYAFCLLDVDLYRPIKNALPSLYESLSPGGVIIVDDCDPTVSEWDGADQAYREFMESIGQAPEIHHDKLGVVRKPLLTTD